MSSKKIHKPRTYEAPYYIQKINLGNNNRRVRKRPPKLCPDCKETSNCVKLISNKINRIEEIINNFDKYLSTKNLNLAPMEVDNPLEYALYCSNDWSPMDLD